MKPIPTMELTLVRVVAPHFVAGFETDGKVRVAAPILKDLIGMTDDEAREHIAKKGWKASIVTAQIGPPRIVQHEESFEVLAGGKRKFFYFDEVAGHRAINGRPTKEEAFAAAQDHLASYSNDS